MRKEDIGKIIGILRIEAGVTQKFLCHGLCSIQFLSKIETGQRIPDKLMLDMLLQRLGKSPDKMETIVSEEEYHIFCKREEIEAAIATQDFEKAHYMIKEYKKHIKKFRKLHWQYLCKIEAMIEKMEHQDDDACLRLLVQAISYTLPNWKTVKVRKVLLAQEELQLLLMITQEYMETGCPKDAKYVLEFIEKYLKERITDEEELVKIYPKYVYLCCQLYEIYGELEEYQNECEKAIRMLTRNGVLYYLDELLEYQLRILKLSKREIQLEKVKKQRDVLREVCREYGIQSESGWYHIFTNNTQREVHLSHELIRGERISQKISQEELCEGVYQSYESISRIENGKEAPNHKKFAELMDKLDLDVGIYNTYITTDDFAIYEKERKLRSLIGRHEYNQADDLLFEIKQKLDDSLPENKQFLLSNEAILDLRLGNIREQEALEQNKKALEYTASFMENGIYRVPRMREFVILNQIAIIYRRMGKRKDAIKLLEETLNCYYNSKVDMKYHYASVITILLNLSSWLEEEGMLEEAEEICKEGIRFSLRCGRVDKIGVFTTNRAVVLEKMNKLQYNVMYIEKIKHYLQQGYYLSDLFENFVDRDAIGEYYRKNYNNTIEH